MITHTETELKVLPTLDCFTPQSIAETSQIIQVLSERLAANGLNVVTRLFPRKIMSAPSFKVSMKQCLKRLGRELQQIIDDASIPGSPFVLLNDSNRLTTERPEKKRKLAELTKPHESSAPQTTWTTLARHNLDGSNSTVLEEAHFIIKTESRAMVQLTDQALTWFLLSHCKGKDPCSKVDQDNRDFREELLSELQRAQEAAINMHASITKTHISRADLCSKIADHPEIEDYTLALQEHDEHQVLLLRQNIRDLRNVYMVLYDLVKAVT